MHERFFLKLLINNQGPIVLTDEDKAKEELWCKLNCHLPEYRAKTKENISAYLEYLKACRSEKSPFYHLPSDLQILIGHVIFLENGIIDEKLVPEVTKVIQTTQKEIVLRMKREWEPRFFRFYDNHIENLSRRFMEFSVSTTARPFFRSQAKSIDAHSNEATKYSLVAGTYATGTLATLDTYPVVAGTAAALAFLLMLYGTAKAVEYCRKPQVEKQDNNTPRP